MADTTCPVCGHEWSRHDPEDGKCDAGNLGVGQTGFGPCMCGRAIEYHRKRNADLSTHALEEARPTT